jgi:RNA polymerase sigma factor (sigma-70 family)
VTLTDAAIHELLQRARIGDEAAAASLIGGMRERVFRWALVMTRDSDDAEDVAQQVSMSVHKSLNGFEARSSFSTWLYAVVRNTSVELMRKAARRNAVALNDDTVDATLSASTNDRLTAISNQRTMAIVRAFFADLPTRQRELIELVDTEGYSAAEAARMIGIEPETARVHLLRARRTLRSKMLEAYPEMFI